MHISIKFGKNPLRFTLSYCPESKVWMYCGQIKMDNLPISNLEADLHKINAMHILSLVKIYWYLLKLSSRNENTDMSRAYNSVKNWQNLPISNPKPDLYNINPNTKFGENPLTFTSVIIRKWNFGHIAGRQMSKIDKICLLTIPNQISIISTDGWMDRNMDGQMDGQTDRHRDSQHDIIIPHHFCVVGYKNYTVFNHSKMDEIPEAKQFVAKIRKFPDFSMTFLMLRISLTLLQNSLTLIKNKISLDFPWLVANLLN